MSGFDSFKKSFCSFSLIVFTPKATLNSLSPRDFGSFRIFSSFISIGAEVRLLRNNRVLYFGKLNLTIGLSDPTPILSVHWLDRSLSTPHGSSENNQVPAYFPY